jgi:maltose O-acetyltransferase
MPTEKEKMLAGELYDASDAELSAERLRARHLLKALNDCPPDDGVMYHGVLTQLIGELGAGTYIQPPFYCDYGGNIILGQGVFMNFNCIILDCNIVRIGDNTMMGPNVQIYAATHPILAAERIKGPELGYPITIGKNVWIGGGAIIGPGVTIGDNTTIGAGSVVTKDIPANVFAAGNPCRVIRELG